MDWKKIFCAGLTAAMIFSVPIATQAATSATEKLSQIERDAYGEEQVGAILNRIGKIEKDFSGKNMQGNMNARIDTIYDSLYKNSGEPSVISRLNALEWNYNHEVSSGGVEKRISVLESALLGEPNSGGFIDRINALSNASFGGANIPLVQMQIPANTLIKVALVDSITSRDLSVGDEVKIKVAEDVIIGGKLVFAKGAVGKGIVENVRKAKGWTGRNGKVEIDFNELQAVDGQTLKIFVGDEAKQEMVDKQMVDGASLVAMDLNSDWSKVLVRGKNVDVKPGAELFVQLKDSAAVFGLQVEGGNLKISPAPITTTSAPIDEMTEYDDNLYLDDVE